MMRTLDLDCYDSDEEVDLMIFGFEYDVKFENILRVEQMKNVLWLVIYYPFWKKMIVVCVVVRAVADNYYQQ